MRVFVTWDDPLVKHMFKEKGWEIETDFSKPFDLLCLPGGIDINPFLYGERPTHTKFFNTRRDNCEIKYWKGVPSTLPKVGICRGAQLGNILCGGSLWQNVDNHMGKHMVKDFAFTDRWKYLIVSSDHHQMCRITDDALLLAAGKASTKKEAESDHKSYGIQVGYNAYEDPEAFYYDNFNFLGVQFHPEYTPFKQCREYFWDLVDECFSKDLYKVQERTAGDGVLEKQHRM